LTGGLTLLLGGTDIAHALGRKGSFTGRTDIWAALIPAAPNAIIGAGFESFWTSPSVLKFQQTLRAWGWWHPDYLNEAHDGYLEVYLNLGCVGVGLIALIIMDGYRRAAKAFQRDQSIGSLFLALIITSAFYNITEAGFRMLDLMWVFLLLAAAGARGVSAHLIVDRAPTRLRRGSESELGRGEKRVLKVGQYPAKSGLRQA
jgi:exopolysaccharide production protein ExoQ